MTAEQLYNLYHKIVFHYEKGFYPKDVKNFEKAKSRKDWIYFQKLSELIERTGKDHIDPEFYIKCLVDFFKGRFPAKMLVHLKGFKIYKMAKQEQNNEQDLSIVREKVLKSLKFTINFMKENNIKTIEDYIMSNSMLIPDIASHLYSGSISRQFFAILPNIENKIKLFPPDVKIEYFDKIEEWLPRTRLIVGRDEKLRKLSANIDKVVQLALN